MRSQEMCVVHVAAPGDEPALQTLCHVARALVSAGVAQVLLVLERGRGAEAIRCAGVPAEIRALRHAGPSFLPLLGELRAALGELCRERSVYAVHLHGVLACLAGARALVDAASERRVIYSPHLQVGQSPWTAAFLTRLLRHARPSDHATATASPWDAEPVSKALGRSAEVLPPPVADAYFAVVPRPASRPRVLVHGLGAEAVAAAAQLCVVLNARAPRVPICWLASATPEARRQLAAAGVEELRAEEDAARAQELSRADAFLDLCPGAQRPLAVAQAMAAGVPCLVSDTPAHRSLVRHGETGLVCTTERDFLDKLVLLLRDRRERERLGLAARMEAQARFTVRRFEQALLRAYGFSRGATLRTIVPPAPARAGTAEPEVLPMIRPAEESHERRFNLDR